MGLAFRTHGRSASSAGNPPVSALVTRKLLPRMDVPFHGPAGRTSAWDVVATALPGVAAYHAEAGGLTHGLLTAFAEGPPAVRACDHRFGSFLFQK